MGWRLLRSLIGGHRSPAALGEETIVQRASFLTALAIAVAIAGSASAQQKITIGGTPNSGPATAMVAQTEGIFAKHGLDATYTLITINPSIPPALVSGSLQIGIPTPTTFLQAVDGGLDLVVIAGVANNAKSTPLQIVVRKDGGIKDPKDLAGKKFGAPGLNAVLHVMTRHWLASQGIDPKSVNFVEAVFPVHGDMLRSGQIDAVVTVDPFATGILGRGDGVLLADLMSLFPEGNPNQMYVTTRDYALKNPQVISSFRAAINEAAAFIAANPKQAREDVGKVLKLPPPAIADLILPAVDTKVTPEQLAFWIDVMRKQNMLSRSLDPAKLILN
jgi:NitT/TauT family transport system substrate-binding protein